MSIEDPVLQIVLSSLAGWTAVVVARLRRRLVAPKEQGRVIMKYGRTRQWSHTCPECGKHAFQTRAEAKATMRRAHPGDGLLSVYRCGDVYHYGHLGYGVRRGWTPREVHH